MAALLCCISLNSRGATNQITKAQIKQQAVASTATRNKVIKITPSSIVISVNGAKITKAEYERYFKMLYSLFCYRNSAATEKQKAAMRKKIRQSAAKPMIQRLIVETKLSGMQVSNLPDIENRIKREYEKAFGGKGKRFNDIQRHMTKAGFKDLFDRDYTLDVKLNSVFATTYSNELSATESEIAEIKRGVLKYNERAAATNALHEVLGAKLVKMAREKGADFAALADKYSQDTEKAKGGLLGERSEVDFTDESPAYWNALKSLKEGGVSDLLVTSEGYEIVRVNKRISPNDSNSGEFALNLSRIFLRKAYEFPEQSDDEFKTDVIQEKREKFFKEFLNKLVKESKVEFPSGAEALR